MNIDLRTCKPGQKLKTRCGDIATYHEYRPNASFQHLVYKDKLLLSFKDDGSYNGLIEHDDDIVMVYPICDPVEQKKSDVIHHDVFMMDNFSYAVYELQERDGKYAWINVIKVWDNDLKVIPHDLKQAFFKLSNKSQFTQVKLVTTSKYIPV